MEGVRRGALVAAGMSEAALDDTSTGIRLIH
jgi:hypothetical protein